ncbi:hypothetical protein GCK32_013779 [Trichostrongylus colubriformis]|uniref:Uncharacterized protein n=1 Tax=Trichostrongylus colubriformis TaxID=6319 RepID=A0AAN8EV19_TRICO
MKPRSLSWLVATVCVSSTISLVTSKELVFVQAIWRHGDRAPLKLPYPKDPYTESAWQRGWGQLTNIGMQQLNELGRYFRTTYNFFVSNVYIPSEVYIRASDSDRALTSAQAFTSGFYPANGSFEWQPGVEADDNEQAKRYNMQYSEMFQVLGEGTGIANFSYKNINRIYDINRELIHGMTEKQPSWVFKYWPQYSNRSTMDIIYELRTIRWVTKCNSTSKANMIAGYLLNNFIKNAKNVANGSMTNPKKMLLYSSHHGTLLSLLYALGVGNNLTVPYGAAIIMEVYKDGKDFQVEWFYRNDSTKAPYPLKIPECGSPCTVNKMAKQYNNIVVDSYAAQQKVARSFPRLNMAFSSGTDILRKLS